MKLLKLFPAALAVLALASCSTDEIESIQPAEQNIATKGDLRITFDPLQGDVLDLNATRAMADRNFGGPLFEDGDMVFVYDEKMHSTDPYEFDADPDKMAFYFAPQFGTDEPLINGEGENVPAFGVYAGITEKNEDEFNSVKKYPKGWVARNLPGTPTCVDIDIPHVLKYKQDGNTYGFEMPAFGAASFNEGSDPYIKLDNFRYLTALLRVKLTNAFGNATFLRLSNNAGKALSGKLTAKLWKGDDRFDSKLEVVDPDYETFDELYIDLSEVPSTTSFIYIPVVAGLDGDTDGIRLMYTGKRNISDVESELDDDGNPIAWEVVPGMQFPGVEFEANHAYAGSYGFELKDMSPKKVSDLLANYQASTSNININITNSFTIKKGDDQIDNVIYLPNFAKEDMVVTITLGEDFATWANTAGDALVFQDVDPEDPFTGKIILKIAEEATAASGATTVNAGGIKVDVAEGTVVLAGNFSEVGNGKFLSLQSGKFAYGDGTTATTGVDGAKMKLYTTKIGAQSFTVADKAEMTVANDIDFTTTDNETTTVIIDGKLSLGTNSIIGDETTATITVGATGELEGNISTLAGGAGYDKDNMATITVNGKQKGDISDVVDAFFVNVNVAGYVDGNISLRNAIKGTLKLTTTTTAATEKVVTGDVATIGNVEIALGAEGEAIAGKLTMLGAAKGIKLVQGFVNEIYVDVQNSGEWEDRYVNLTLNDTNEGIAAFKSLKVNTTTKNDVRYTESVWNGKMITNADYKQKYTKYQNERAKEEAFLAAPFNGQTDNAVFTASQLASMGTGLNNLRLLNDIDLTGNDATKGKGQWKSIGTLMGSFKAFGHKIKNMNLNNASAYGLFTTTETGAVSVEDLTLENVTLDTKAANVDGIGSVVATSVGTLTVKNVTVTGINFQDTGKKLVNVGGMIGLSTKPVSMDNVKVAGTIDGFAPLGGFIGGANDNVTIAKGDASGIAFKQTYDSGLAMDITYAQIGGFIGNVAASKTVTITDGIAPSTINYDKSAKMYTSNTTVGTGKFYNYQAEQKFIGFSGNKLATYPQMGYSTINGTKYCAEAGWTDGATTAKSHKDGHGTDEYTFLYTWPAHTN